MFQSFHNCFHTCTSVWICFGDGSRPVDYPAVFVGTVIEAPDCIVAEMGQVVPEFVQMFLRGFFGMRTASSCANCGLANKKANTEKVRKAGCARIDASLFQVLSSVPGRHSEAYLSSG